MTFPLETSSSEVLAAEAARRGITVERFHHIRTGFIRLTYKDHSEMLFQSQSNRLGRITARIFSNKVLTSVLLREQNFPAPDDTLAQSKEDVLEFLHKHSPNPIVIKPINTTGGKGVAIDVTSEEYALASFEKAENLNEENQVGVVCQEQVEGQDYRILVINKKHTFTVERVPAHVTGDGTHTIKELVEKNNAESAAGYGIPLHRIQETTLTRAGFTLESIPESGVHVRLMRAANTHLGGKVVNADDVVCESAKKIALDIATYFDCPVLGLDCLTPDLSKSIGKIIELNEAPALYLHEHMQQGKNQYVSKPIIDMLFPETK